MSYTERSFTPPIETEYDTSGTANQIVWSLGTPERPWKNLYIRDYSTEESKLIDIYSSLGMIANVPFDKREQNTVLAVDKTTAKNLGWMTLDTLAKAGSLTADVLTSYVLGDKAVNRAYSDEDGNSIKNTYLKSALVKDSFIVNKLVETHTDPYFDETTQLYTNVVAYAQADRLGNVFEDTYLSKVSAQKLYCPIEWKPLKFTSESNYQEGLTVAFTNSYKSLVDKPTIPSYDGLVEQAVKKVKETITGDPGTKDLHEPRITALETTVPQLATSLSSNVTRLDGRIDAIDTRVTTLESVLPGSYVKKTDYANKVNNNVTYPGIIKVTEGNGLKLTIDSSAQQSTLSYEKPIATSGVLGMVMVANGNGLNINSSGRVGMAGATTTTKGSVLLGIANSQQTENNPYTDFSLVPADGQWYTYRGTLTGTDFDSQLWLIRKLIFGSGTQVYCWAYSTADARLELHSINNGSTWLAPYAGWHA